MSLQQRGDAATGNGSLVELKEKLDQCTRELDDALEQQTATAEILGVISNSLTDTQPVFDAIVQSAVKLFPGALTSIALKDGDMIRGAAAVAVSDPARLEAWRRTFPYPCTRDYMHGKAILDRRVVDIPDVEQAPPELAVGARNFLTSGYRAITIMPMILAAMLRSGRSASFEFARTALGQAGRGPKIVCGAGRHRHREHAAAQRAAPAHRRAERGAGTADRDRRSSPHHQHLAWRLAAGVRRNRNQCHADLRREFRHAALYDGAVFHARALCDVPPAFADALWREPRRAAPSTGLGRLAATKRQSTSTT